MPKERRDKTTGLPLPSPVDPGETICVQLQIPNAPEYIQAFRGVVSDLGKFWAWSRTLGESDDPAREAAELWRVAGQTIVYSSDCDGPMSCSQVKNCIQNDPSTNGYVRSLVQTQTAPGTYSTPGQPMNVAQATARLNAIDGCNQDEFWAQCEQLVDYFVQAGVDVLEAIELYTNAVEAAGFIEMVPLLGTLFDELQIDQFLEFLDWIVSVFQEWYVAADTAPNRTAIKCALFCAGRDDCLITIDGIWDVLNARLGGVLNPGSINTLGDLANALRTLFTNPALALDAWLAFITGSAKLAGYLGVKGIDQTLQITLKLAVNDANNDWELLCECAVLPWCYRLNFKETNGSAQGVVLTVSAPGIPEFSGSQWVPGSGLENVDLDNADRTFASLIRPDVQATSVEMKWRYVDTSGSGNVWIDNDFGTATPVSSPTITHTTTYGTPTSLSNLIFGGERPGSNFTPFIVIEELIIRGEGVNPFGADNC